MYQRFSAHLKDSVDISNFGFDLSETASRVESALTRGSSVASDKFPCTPDSSSSSAGAGAGSFGSSGGGGSGGSGGGKVFDFGGPEAAAAAAAKTISRSQSVTVPTSEVASSPSCGSVGAAAASPKQK